MKAIARAVLVAMSFICAQVTAQPFQIEESTPFPEPEAGALRVMLLPNGNTALIHITREEGINFKLFDSGRKQILQRVITPKFGRKGRFGIESAGIESLFPINSDIVLFYSVLEDRAEILYRAIIDTNSGQLSKDEEVGRLLRSKEGNREAAQYMMANNFALPRRFYIRKDKNSDHYGVGIFNIFDTDRNKRIELRHFNGKHEIINQAFYVSPNNEFKSMKLVDFIVMGGEKIIACAYVFNTGDDKASLLSTAQLVKGSPSIQLKQLDFTQDYKITNGVLRQIPGTDMVALLSLAELDSKKNTTYYGAFLSFLNSKTLALEYQKTIDTPGLREAYQKIMGPKKEFTGVPQDMYVNEDGTYTIVFEEIKTMSSQSSTSTRLGSTGVCILNKEAKEIYNYIIPKIHDINFTSYEPMYISRREEDIQYLVQGRQYKSFAYVNSVNKKYIFFNDLAENLELIKKSKVNNVYTISDTDAFSCALSKGEVDRQFLFGKPARNCHTFAMFTVSDYDPRSGTYATLKLDNCKGKNMQLVWMNLK